MRKKTAKKKRPARKAAESRKEPRPGEGSVAPGEAPQGAAPVPEDGAAAKEGGEDRGRERQQQARREARGRVRIDEGELGRKAWKVFQQEVGEEGLALIDADGARRLAEKSILVTRAFLEERERRLGGGR